MTFIRDQLAATSRKALLYFSVGRYDAAEKLLRSSLADHGPLANILNLLGLCFHQQARFADAIREYRRASELNPDFVEASLNLAATLCDLGSYEEARELCTQISLNSAGAKNLPKLTLGRIANLHAATGQAYERVGQWQDAIQEYRRALQVYPRLPDIKLNLARLYLQTQLLDKAQTELEELMSLSPGLAEVPALLGLVYRKRGNKTLAREYWQKAEVLAPHDVVARTYVRIASLEAQSRG